MWGRTKDKRPRIERFVKRPELFAGIVSKLDFLRFNWQSRLGAIDHLGLFMWIIAVKRD